METLLSVLLGIGLSAACGLRVFAPLAVAGGASLAGILPLNQELAWIGTLPAVIAFGVATIVEIASYYIPAVDNLLDTITSPLAVVAGTLLTVSVLSPEFSPTLRWILGIIAGGGVAAATQGSTVALRSASTTTTATFGNSLVATSEAGGSIFLSITAILVPVVAAFLGLLLIFGMWRVVLKIRSALRSPS